jgi:hypothetical protein
MHKEVCGSAHKHRNYDATISESVNTFEMECSNGYSPQDGQHSPAGVTREEPVAVKMKLNELNEKTF